METKRCSNCGDEKELKEFHYSKLENRHHSWCKVCLYRLQKQRWRDRKRRAVELLGGKCDICRYDRNLAVLSFHHKDPADKEFNWNKLVLKNWDAVIHELKKCRLLCSNCHIELHHPNNQDVGVREMDVSNNNLNKENVTNTEPYVRKPREKKIKEIKVVEPSGRCPSCNKETYGTKYCSTRCSALGNRKVKRPSKEELENLLKTGNINLVSKQYGVSWQAVKKWTKQYQMFDIKETINNL